MNWFKGPKPLLSFSLLFASCSSGGFGSDTSVDGFLVKLSANEEIPASATIEVTGRNADEFDVKFDSDTPGQFKISGMPDGKSVVLRVKDGTGPVLDTTLSFPFVVGSAEQINLPFVTSGTVQGWVNDVTSPTGVLNAYTVDRNLGIVAGQLVPGGGTCGTTVGVDIASKADPDSSILIPDQNGPFYFNASRQIVAGGFSDAECSYIIFNVPAGDYKFKTVGGASSAEITDLVVLSGSVVLGYGLPLTL